MTTRNLANTANPVIEVTEKVQLQSGDLYCLPHGALNVRVLSGTAWITSQAEDHVLEAGDQMLVPHQPHAVIVSAVGHHSLSFEVRPA
jgi:hypothetical protein